jgi:hypothetical protein
MTGFGERDTTMLEIAIEISRPTKLAIAFNLAGQR